MVVLVKIRFRSAPKASARNRKAQQAALALASLLIPAAVMAYVLAGWRVAADLNITGQFPITEGLFSHWQVWGAGAAVLNFAAILLNRYGKAAPVIRKPTEEPEQKLANSRIYF